MPIKPTEHEDEFFARKDFEKKAKIEHEKHLQMKQEELERLKKLHYMRCPKCGLELIAINYKGMEIDKCSECHGVWLDQGEVERVIKNKETHLDKLIAMFRL